MYIELFGCPECPACQRMNKFATEWLSKRGDLIIENKLNYDKPKLAGIVETYNLPRAIPFMKVDGEWFTDEEFRELFAKDWKDWKDWVSSK